VTADLDTLLTALYGLLTALYGLADDQVMPLPGAGLAGRRTTGYRLCLVRVGRRDEVPCLGSIGWIRHQWTEPVDGALKGQVDLERHGGRTTAGAYARIAQRPLAVATVVRHNWQAAQPVKRSLIAYDH
jgi:hypothetical protein